MLAQKPHRTAQISNLHCYYTNADQLNNKLNELKLIVMDQEPDVIAITEVKPKNNRYQVSEADYIIPNYKIWHTNIDNNSGRGIIIYTKENLSCQEIIVCDNFQENL